MHGIWYCVSWSRFDCTLAL